MELGEGLLDNAAFLSYLNGKTLMLYFFERIGIVEVIQALVVVLVYKHKGWLEEASVVWSWIDFDHASVALCDEFADSKPNTDATSDLRLAHSLVSKEFVNMLDINFLNTLSFISHRQYYFVMVRSWFKDGVLDIDSPEQIDWLELRLRVIKFVIKGRVFHLFSLLLLDI